MATPPAPGHPPPAGPQAAGVAAAVEHAFPGLPPPRPMAMVPKGAPYRRPERPQFGTGPAAWEPEAGQQGVVIMTPTIEELGTTIALAAAKAVHDRVRVEDILLLPAAELPITQPDVRLGAALTRDQEMQRIKQEQAQLQKHENAARRNSEDAESDDERRTWSRRAADYKGTAARLDHELARLRSRPVAHLELPASVSVGPPTLALARIAAPEPASDLAETFAVQQVVRDLNLAADGLLIRGRYWLAVPTADRLLVLGPIDFMLPNRCSNGVAVLLQHAEFTRHTMAPAFRSRHQSQELVQRLTEAPARLPLPAARTAASAFFPAIASLLLGEDPDARAAAWHDPEWAAHLRRTYRGRGVNHVGGPWLLFDPARQGLAYAVADAEPPLTRDHVIGVLQGFGVPNAASRVHQYTVADRRTGARRSGSWTWPPSVRRVRTGNATAWHAVLRPCPVCRGPAELVVRVPELPFACMCPCGGAPGLPPTLLVPPVYRRLAATRAELAGYVAALADPFTIEVNDLIGIPGGGGA